MYSESSTTSEQHVTITHKVSDAVGLPCKHWFIAIVNNNTERTCGTKLTKMGYNTFIPTQKITIYNSVGKRKEVESVLLPSLVLLNITEAERKQVVHLPFIHKFMSNRAGRTDTFNHHPIATIPDDQIETLKFMLGQNNFPVSIESMPPKLGDKVSVVRGELRGLEGYVIGGKEGATSLIVKLDILGCAKVTIDIQDLTYKTE
jgi:transcription antitermination factor NusG